MAPPSGSPTSAVGADTIPLNTSASIDSTCAVAPLPTPKKSVKKTPGKQQQQHATTSNNYAAPNTPIASAKRPRTPHTGKKTPGGKTPARTPGRGGGGGGGSMTSIDEQRAHSGRNRADEGKENSGAGENLTTPGGAATPRTPAASTKRLEAPTPAIEAMSPMHPARPMRSHSPSSEERHGQQLSMDEEASASSSGTWAGKLFSPVLHFLGGSGSEEDGGEEGQVEPQEREGVLGAAARRKDIYVDDDGDVHMDDAGAGANDDSVGAALAAERGDAEEEASVEKAISDFGADPADGDAGHVVANGTRAGGNMVHYAAGRTVYSSHSVEKSTKTTISYSSSPSSSKGREGGNGIDARGSPASSVGSPAYSRSGADDSVDGSVDRSYVHQEDAEVEVSVQESIDEDEEEDEEEFNPYLFIKSLPAYDLVVPPYRAARICLPPKDPVAPPIALVLDLDETLVHCTVEPIPDADMIFPVVFNGVEYRVHVRCRPYLEEFLERVAGDFEVIVFTASQRVYADELLNRIDPEGKYIKHRMFRESCLPVEGNYLKDLNVLGRDLRKAVLVDNSPHAFGYQTDNGIPIESWFDDPHDTELLKLERFLRTLHGKEDVRRVVRDKFQTWRLVAEA
eukprot:CAMPEP_0113558176 /NCGR_PEP_ID=MMETSP0015_2-20120614/18203_1 /TAXON_ID=2838 /ORGANISM="Odontella" /LENGTH=624 /DNA_ID=CAMNT_0000459687 /DNA_START=450 /DNA_END=2324 /DNA_ORIENTATION=- /assembly_acc=CAM_ASM_000160